MGIIPEDLAARANVTVHPPQYFQFKQPLLSLFSGLEIGVFNGNDRTRSKSSTA
jgi:hypothetical protein